MSTSAPTVAVGYTDNRISVRFKYEWRDAAGQWFRMHGNEHWEFAEDGLMRLPTTLPFRRATGGFLQR